VSEYLAQKDVSQTDSKRELTGAEKDIVKEFTFLDDAAQT
jgi:hypothetical protein